MARIPKTQSTEELPDTPILTVDEGVEISVNEEQESADLDADDPGEQGHPGFELDAVNADIERKAHKMVAIRPRRTMMRVRVPSPEGAKWYNFVQNREQMVPAYVRDWLDEQGVL